jgi:hypothetical protein
MQLAFPHQNETLPAGTQVFIRNHPASFADYSGVYDLKMTLTDPFTVTNGFNQNVLLDVNQNSPFPVVNDIIKIGDYVFRITSIIFTFFSPTRVYISITPVDFSGSSLNRIRVRKGQILYDPTNMSIKTTIKNDAILTSRANNGVELENQSVLDNAFNFYLADNALVPGSSELSFSYADNNVDITDINNSYFSSVSKASTELTVNMSFILKKDNYALDEYIIPATNSNRKYFMVFTQGDLTTCAKGLMIAGVGTISNLSFTASIKDIIKGTVTVTLGHNRYPNLIISNPLNLNAAQYADYTKIVSFYGLPYVSI